jgi:hypothetical protein
MTPAEVIALLDDPPTLLRKCYLHIAGGSGLNPPANGQASVATFSVKVVSMEDRTDIQMVKGFTTGLSGFLGLQKDRWFVKINKLSGVAKDAPGPEEFNAYYIPMVQTADVAAGTSHYTLPTGNDALKNVITSKLSGCTFGVGSDGGGAVLVSHVQPNNATADADQRALDLSAAVNQGLPNPKGQFDKGGAYTDKAAVIGHLDGGEWKFYLQAFDLDDKTHKDVISKIVTI